MAINITTILEDDYVSVSRSIINDNFSELKTSVETVSEDIASLTTAAIGGLLEFIQNTPISSSQISEVNSSALVGNINAALINQVNSTALVGNINAALINQVNASALVGNISADRINAVNASVLVGNINAANITEVNAGVLTGSINADRITTVRSSVLTGPISAGLITEVNASALSGTISADRITTVNTTALNGVINASQITNVNATAINGVILTAQLADGILSSLAKFAPDMRPVVIVAALPTLPNTNYPIGSKVYLSADDGLRLGHKTYTNVSGVWDATIGAGDISGQIQSSQINSIEATQINGLILAAQIGSVNSSVLNGAISATNITVVNSSALSGAISAALITEVNATALTGSINAARITTVNAGAITGSISATNITTVNSSALTGAISAALITEVNATALTGNIAADRITSVNATALTGNIAADRITSVNAAALTGDIAAARITSVNASAITGNITAGGPVNIAAGTITIGTLTSSQIGSVDAGTITVGYLNAARIAGASIDITKVNLRQIYVSGTFSGNNTTTVSWTGITIYWNGTAYSIGTGSTTNKYIWWESTDVSGSSQTVFVTGNTFVPLRGRYLIATNVVGVADEAWDKLAVSSITESNLGFSLLVGVQIQPVATVSGISLSTISSDPITTPIIDTTGDGTHTGGGLISVAVRVATVRTTTPTPYASSIDCGINLKFRIDEQTANVISIFPVPIFDNGNWIPTTTFTEGSSNLASKIVGDGSTIGDSIMFNLNVGFRSRLQVWLEATGPNNTSEPQLGSYDVSLLYATKTS